LQAPGWTTLEVPFRSEIARYIIHYADGTTETAPMRNGIEVMDWYFQDQLQNGALVWTSKILGTSPIRFWEGHIDDPHPTTLCVSSWDNPHPEKTIATIDVVGDLTEAQLVLFGITGGTVAQ